MTDEHEQFISEEDEELKHIKEKKLKELVKTKEKKHMMKTKPATVTDADFDKIVNEHRVALIDCWAPWCGPCLAFAPTIEELAEEHEGKVFVGKLNVDENPQTAKCFEVFSIPTLLIMKDGCEVDRIVGCAPKKQVETVLKKHLE